jgi:hypothetical protein
MTRSIIDPRTIHPANLEIVATRMAAFDKRKGPRTGDFLRLPVTDPRQGDLTRFTDHWGNFIQTGGSRYGSYYLGFNFLSYSGGLDSGLAVSDILPTDETIDGSLWIFDLDCHRAGRGVDFMRPMRVFTVRDGANLDGIGELRCPYHLTCCPHCSRSNDYAFVITKHAMPCTAFRTDSELIAWLTEENLHAWHPFTKSQFLQYHPKK